MSPLNLPSVSEKLAKLREVIDKLEQCKKASQQEFVSDFRISDSAMHNLVLGVEIIVDIGNHILAEVFQIKTAEYAEVIEKLGKAKVIPEALATENIAMAKFRNLIIHQYEDIDLRQVYENLQKAPHAFQEFAKHFAEFFERQK